MLAWGALLCAAVGGAFAVAVLAAPAPPRPRCRPGMQCGAPPIVISHAAFAFPGYTLWQSSGLGFSLRYDSSLWSVAAQDADAVQLQSADGFSVLAVAAVPASQASPAALMDQRLSSLRGQLLGVSADASPDDALLSPNVGFIAGIDGVYTGTVATPQGPQAPASIVLLAAGNGAISAIVTVITPGGGSGDQAAVYQQADDIIDSIRWPS